MNRKYNATVENNDFFVAEHDVVQTSHPTASAYVTEASTLGFRPGFFPAEILTSLGNELPLMANHVERDDEMQVLYVDYLQANGCVHLRVFND